MCWTLSMVFDWPHRMANDAVMLDASEEYASSMSSQWITSPINLAPTFVPRPWMLNSQTKSDCVIDCAIFTNLTRMPFFSPLWTRISLDSTVVSGKTDLPGHKSCESRCYKVEVYISLLIEKFLYYYSRSSRFCRCGNLRPSWLCIGAEGCTNRTNKAKRLIQCTSRM